MNWVAASLLMFISSVGLYLFVRSSNSLKTPQQLNNLAMFLIPVIVYATMSVNYRTNFNLTPFAYGLIVVQAVFFSYLGNVFSLKGIEAAPNPGYSLIISKSYVAFTAIASIFLFNAPLTIKSVAGITLIILFSAIITVDKSKSNTHSNRMWIPYTIGAFFCWGLLALSSKYLLNLGVPILARLIYTMIIVSMIIMVEVVYKKVQWQRITRSQLFSLMMIGVFGSSFNYYMQVGFNLAPNVGYVNATNAASISLLTLMSALIFKDELTPRKMVGIAGVTAGLLVLFL